MENYTDNSSALAQIGSADICLLGDLVPEDEQAITDTIDYEQIRKQGFFSSAYGMKKLSGSYDGQIYAKICVDKDSKRTILFCQRYENGDFSPVISVAQSDLLFASLHEFIASNITTKKQQSKMEKFLIETTDKYLGSFCGDTILNIVDILTMLATSIGSLPVYRDNNGELTSQQLYGKVMDVVTGRTGGPVEPYGEHRSYFAFNVGQMRYIAEQIDMDYTDMLKLLKKYSLLYLTPSSRGYETKVRLEDNYTDWAYCLVKLDYFEQTLKGNLQK